MDIETPRLSGPEFVETAESFGYTYTVCPLAGDQAPLFAGGVAIRSFSSGLSVCASDLTALRASEHDGFVERSFTIALLLEGTSSECRLGLDDRLSMGPGHALQMSAVDRTRLGGRVASGQRLRSLLVRARPEDLVDEHLADRVDAALRSTSALPFSLSVRSQALGHELLVPSLVGSAGHLLAESCALELLARSPLFAEPVRATATGPLNRRDLARMEVVRDALTAEPDREHHLSDLARLAGVSVTALKTKFVAVFGQPVFAFLRDVRLERARRGLEQEGWTIAQAAYHSGYRHPTSFTFAFRRQYGIAPSAVRRR